MIYIHCDGNFAQRYYALLSGLYLAKQLQYKAVIRWPLNYKCEASVKDIFENYIPEFSICDATLLYVSDAENSSINPMHYNVIDEIAAVLTQANSSIYYSVTALPQWASNIQVYDIIHNELRFAPNLVNAANNIIHSVVPNESYYGLHVRKTDNEKLINEDFYYNLISHNKQKRFFVCSDDQETESKFLQIATVFTYKKIAYPTKLNPYTDWSKDNVYRYKNSILESIVDLIVLSKSMIINTNAQSNFLKLAVLLNGYTVYTQSQTTPELRITMAQIDHNVT